MIRLVVADDHAIVREGIKKIILDEDDMQLVAEAENGNQVLTLMRKEKVDILLLDISMPGPGFLEIMQRLKHYDSPFRILVLSIHPEEQYAKRALKAGASGYLTKNRSPEELVIAIRRIHSGGKYISPTLAEQLANDLTSERGDQLLHQQLSDREYQILVMLGDGLTTSNIAKILSLSPKTVSTYRTRICEKMGFQNYAQLIRYTIKHGLTN